MLRNTKKTALAALLAAIVSVTTAAAQPAEQEYGDYERVARVDRYLDAEVWTNHYDGEYYEGDNIVIHFRVSRDAFVVIYSIDTRGRVNLLFPADPTQDNFVYGGITNSLPGEDDGYDLMVNGPEGLEHLQIIASRERFSVPNWYHNSGLVFTGDDRYDYMDYLNDQYFVRYDGQRFAYDRAVIFVDEWEPYYYRPVYYPGYPAWSVCGNAYIDYPWGATVYVNGYYWGVAPLYIPRLVVGWHTVTIYDHYGYCWESDFHVSRYNTVVFSRTVVKTSATVTSKYAAVRKVGYRDPVMHGYPNFSAKPAGKNVTKLQAGSVTGTKTLKESGAFNDYVLDKKYVRGSTKLVKTKRGYETDVAGSGYTGKAKSVESSKSEAAGERRVTSYSEKTTDRGTSGKSTIGAKDYSPDKSVSGESSGYYEKKSGTSGKVRSGSGKAQSDPKVRVGSKSGAATSKPKGDAGKTPSVKSSKEEKSADKPSGSVKSRTTSKPSGGKSGGSVGSGSTSSSGSSSSGKTGKSSGGSSGKKSGSGGKGK
ncbi:MAG TPA: DUF4384 domain-containing protein [Acidobacteriota bacterium]|nr:DUF4384 domain-containing protein [Acidobacteriota bacterium]